MAEKEIKEMKQFAAQLLNTSLLTQTFQFWLLKTSDLEPLNQTDV